MKNDVVLKIKDKDVLDITTYGSANDSRAAIICVHGFKGFKDWGFWPYAANYMAELNYFVITFNFSHNGVSVGSVNFDEPEKFAANTFSREVDELNELVNATAKGFFDKKRFNKIFLLGHSRGGFDSIIVAARNSNVKALVTWASIAEIDRYSDRQKAEWRKKGYWEVVNTRTKQVMKLNIDLLEDIESNINDKLNIRQSIHARNIPWLIIHGEQDVTVKKDEAEKLFNYSNKKITEIQLIPNAGHTFNAVHPFRESNLQLNETLDLTINYFNKY